MSVLKHTARSSISPFFQKVFIVSVLLVWVIQLAIQVIFSIRVFEDNPNLSSFYSIFLYIGLLPILFYVITTLINPIRVPSRATLFQNLFLTVTGVMIASFVSSSQFYLYSEMGVVMGGQWGWWAAELIASVIVTIGYAALLIFARRTKRW